MDPSSPGRVLKLRWNREAIAPLPKFVHKQNLLTRSALGAIESPATKPAEASLELIAGEHHMRIETDPTGQQGLFALDGRPTWLELEPIGSLAAIVKYEAASKSTVEKVTDAKGR